MRLTFIVPLYNRETFIEAALRSLLLQRADCELDILVVNDGSTDSGPARVEALAARFGHIRMLSVENQGITRTRNLGLANVADDTDFVSFLDSDDVSPAQRISSDLREFESDPSLQFTYGKMTFVDRIDDAELVPAADAQVATVRGIQLGAGIYRRQFLRSLGLFDESFEQAEDTDFLFRAFESNAAHRLTETNCVYYRRHPGNMTCDSTVALKSFMRAIHRSLTRRRIDPSLRMPTDVFDLKKLVEIRSTQGNGLHGHHSSL